MLVSHQDPVQSARLALTGRSLRLLQVDKPGHGSVTTLIPAAGWQEESYWLPDTGRAAHIFPPV